MIHKNYELNFVLYNLKHFRKFMVKVLKLPVLRITVNQITRRDMQLLTVRENEQAAFVFSVCST
jgi:hypothetical protein